jgi:hypothetical protein
MRLSLPSKPYPACCFAASLPFAFLYVRTCTSAGRPASCSREHRLHTLHILLRSKHNHPATAISVFVPSQTSMQLVNDTHTEIIYHAWSIYPAGHAACKHSQFITGRPSSASILVLLAPPYIDIGIDICPRIIPRSSTRIDTCAPLATWLWLTCHIISYHMVSATRSIPNSWTILLLFSTPLPFALFYASSAMHHEHLSCLYMHKLYSIRC